jgi:hypothetical protein
MLEEVDSIDWKAIGSHVSGSNEHIPVSLREVLSDDAATREYALGFLLGAQQDFGDIYDTTPLILRFLFEILAAAPLPVKASLLDHLIGQAETMHTSPRSINDMRNYVATYDLFKAHLPLLQELLYAPEQGIRLGALAILAQMKAEIRDVQPMLLEYFQNGLPEQECVHILGALKSLWWGRSAIPSLSTDFDTSYQRVLEDTLAAHPLPVVRVAAARALANQLAGYEWRDTPLLQTVSTMLVKEFFDQRVRFDREYPGISHTLPIIHEISRLHNGRAVLCQILSHPDITPEQAHLIGRAILARELLSGTYQHDQHWSYHPRSFYRTAEAAIYGFRTRGRDAIHARSRPALARLVESDAFWAQPSNLLSFFYGLPDDRADLRALLEAQ